MSPQAPGSREPATTSPLSKASTGHPPRTALTRSLPAGVNLGRRVTGQSFRVFVHPPAAMAAVLERRGLRPVLNHRGLAWEVQGLTR